MDARDQELIDLLIEDPRASLTSLAKKMHISVTSVSKRLKKIEEQNLIRFEVSLNLHKFKMTHAFMFIETTNAQARTEIINKFQGCPLVDKIYDLIGWEFHLVIGLISPDSKLLNNFMTYCPIRYMDGIKRINAYYSLLEQSKPIFLPITNRKLSMNSSCGSNCAKDCSRYQTECPGCPAIEYVSQT